MASILRHTAVWTGSPGLPGYTQFYQSFSGAPGTAAQTGQDLFAAFFTALASLVPEEVTVTVDPVYRVINDVTGAITSEGTVGSPKDPLTGTYTGEWSRQVGVMVEWTTGLFLNRRRFRGRTFLVPLGASAATDGTLPDGTLATVRAAAAGIVTSGYGFLVWHRPVAGAGGISQPITGAVVRDHAAVLRSRMR